MSTANHAPAARGSFRAERSARWHPSGSVGRQDYDHPMSHRIIVWTGKGGTGKTTTVVNLAPELARLGYRVLAVGFDPQPHLELTFGIPREDAHVVRVEQLLAGGIDVHTALVDIEIPGAVDGGRLAILPCSPELVHQTAAVQRRGFHDLDRLLGEVDDEFDLILIDTQGALTPISQTAVRAADSLLFTMEPGFFEYDALTSRLEELDALAAEGWALALLGVLFVRTDRRSRHMREFREHFADSQAFGESLHVFDTHIRPQLSVRDHPRLGLPTALAEPDSHVGADYRSFAVELVAHLASRAEASA